MAKVKGGAAASSSSSGSSRSPKPSVPDPPPRPNSPRNARRTSPSEDERPAYPRRSKEALALQERVLRGGLGGSQRPGAVIETEEQLEIKRAILEQIRSGKRAFDNAELLDECFGGDDGVDAATLMTQDDADPDEGETMAAAAREQQQGGEDILDARTIGTWTIEDVRSKFEYEWDPHDPETDDPNVAALNQFNARYVEETPKLESDPTVERGYDPIFGPSSPVDRRTILGAKDSYVVDPATRDETKLQPQFSAGDPEIDFNRAAVEVRSAMDIMETYVRATATKAVDGDRRGG
jgi:hypothetical protein